MTLASSIIGGLLVLAGSWWQDRRGQRLAMKKDRKRVMTELQASFFPLYHRQRDIRSAEINLQCSLRNNDLKETEFWREQDIIHREKYVEILRDQTRLLVDTEIVFPTEEIRAQCKKIYELDIFPLEDIPPSLTTTAQVETWHDQQEANLDLYLDDVYNPELSKLIQLTRNAYMKAPRNPARLMIRESILAARPNIRS